VSGFVWLVGAGPGDPELLTRKAARLLAEADLVLYDALVSPAALALAAKARRFPVGKRAFRPSMDQETIQALMVRAARRGQRVVRLKGGDPFVFGRGGEEGLALRRAGVPFEIVPGVSAAVAAPALAGIPVTHRGVASGFVVVSGHDAAAYEPVLGGLRPGSATVVVLMGLAQRRALAGFLVDRGWPADTPAAIVHGASWDDERAWTGDLAGLRDDPLADADDALPGTIVVGGVVALASALGPVALPAAPIPVASSVRSPAAARASRSVPRHRKEAPWPRRAITTA
jgi:uroporphyrin-III C-methyltransferase/precorrin-2 dehydrogenase/sirohydrochlorin ferrochelatase